MSLVCLCLPCPSTLLCPDLSPSSGHRGGKDTGNKRGLLPLAGRHGAPGLRAASGVQFVIPPLCAPDQGQDWGAGHPRTPHPCSLRPSPGPGQPFPITRAPTPTRAVQRSLGLGLEAEFNPGKEVTFPTLGKRLAFLMFHGQGYDNNSSLPSALYERRPVDMERSWPWHVRVSE